jgi:inositol hexakisphosphate/diphosphoinositol-pentakisphosphate kinase
LFIFVVILPTCFSGIDFNKLYYAVKPLANWIVPQEYGIDFETKTEISKEICSPLVRKLISDLTQTRDERHQLTTTRFYFTSESHIHSLLTTLELRFGLPVTCTRDVNYISHINWKMHENFNLPKEHPNRFEVEVLLLL